MSTDPRIQALSATGAFIGATGTLIGTVAGLASKGRVSTSTYAREGIKLVGKAEELMYKKHTEGPEGKAGQYIVSNQDRIAFKRDEIDPMYDMGDRLEKASRTMVGSIRHWNESRDFYQRADYVHHDAERLSERSFRAHLFREEALEIQKKMDEAQGSRHSSGENGVDGGEDSQENSDNSAFPPTNIQQHGHEGVDPRTLQRSERSRTARTQKSYSTARGESPGPGRSHRYTSGAIYESPTVMEGPSFARGYPPLKPQARDLIYKNPYEV